MSRRVVLKHRLFASMIDKAGLIHIQLPPNARVLLIGHQPDPQHGSDVLATVWAEGDVPDNGRWLGGDPAEVWKFNVIGTGDQPILGLPHIGSVMAGPFVWHVYGKLDR